MRDKHAAQCYIADKCHRLDINPDPSNKKSVTKVLGSFCYHGSYSSVTWDNQEFKGKGRG